MTKRKYKLYRPHSSSPLMEDTSLWEVLRFIAHLFKTDSYSSLTITKE